MIKPTRTIAFLLVLISLSAVTAGAATQVGARGGLNVGNINFVGRTAYDDFRMGVAAGVFATFEKSERFAYQPEILYMQVGDEGGFNQETQTLKLDYVQVPLLLRFDFAPTNKYHPYFVFGPAVGMLVGATEASKVEGADAELDEYQEPDATAGLDGESEIDVRSDFFLFDVGLVAGIGGEIFQVFEDNAVGIEVRYNLGILDLDEFTADNVSAKTATFTIAAFFTFF